MSVIGGGNVIGIEHAAIATRGACADLPGAERIPAYVPGAEVAAAISQAAAAGHRSLLLVLRAVIGGPTNEAFQVIRAIADFQARGGLVVAHVDEIVASTAPVVALAADLVIMDPGSLMVFHSCLGAFPPEEIAEANRLLLEVLVARSAVPRPVAELWLAKRGLDSQGCDATRAAEFGLADVVAPEPAAWAWVQALGQGFPLPPTVRQEAITQRSKEAA